MDTRTQTKWRGILSYFVCLSCLYTLGVMRTKQAFLGIYSSELRQLRGWRTKNQSYNQMNQFLKLISKPNFISLLFCMFDGLLFYALFYTIFCWDVHCLSHIYLLFFHVYFNLFILCLFHLFNLLCLVYLFYGFLWCCFLLCFYGCVLYICVALCSLYICVGLCVATVTCHEKHLVHMPDKCYINTFYNYYYFIDIPTSPMPCFSHFSTSLQT